MNKQIIFVMILALGLGAAAGYWYALERKGMELSVPMTAAERAREPLFYRNPMNPAVTSPVPAKDEMGMDYIPVYAGEDSRAGEPAGTVIIDPVTEQNIGIRTAPAKRQTLAREIRTVGRVDYNEEMMTRLHPKIEGWIEKLYVDKTGEPVSQDTILLSIYSPQLVTSQQEYLLALNSLEALKASTYEDIRRGSEEMVRISRQRLELLDVPEHQIRELEKSRKIMKNLHIHSPFNGVVLKIGAREGQYVTPGTELYMIADLSRVWVYADIYEDELPWIKVGDEVEMGLKGLPGRRFKGRLVYVYPYAEAKTRTIKVRLEFDNPDRLLKPDMYANVMIHSQRQVNAVVVPAEAVVRSGLRDQIFVVRGPGKFEPRKVKLGISAGGLVQVLEGVTAGEEVVTSSQFLIDSESKLREATAKMLERTQTKQTGSMDVTEGMDMDEMKNGGQPVHDMEEGSKDVGDEQGMHVHD